MDLFLLALMVLLGTVFAVWLISSPKHDVQQLISQMIDLTTILLAQPGIFLSIKLLRNTAMPKLRRYILSASAIIVLALCLPIAISSWLTTGLSGLI